MTQWSSKMVAVFLPDVFAVRITIVNFSYQSVNKTTNWLPFSVFESGPSISIATDSNVPTVERTIVSSGFLSVQHLLPMIRIVWPSCKLHLQYVVINNIVALCRISVFPVGGLEASDYGLGTLFARIVMSGQTIVALRILDDCLTSMPLQSNLYCDFWRPTVFAASMPCWSVVCSAMNCSSAGNSCLFEPCLGSLSMNMLPFVTFGCNASLSQFLYMQHICSVL